ncbi:hypothetical protein BKA57DRAFT_504252 [Linnemannia elongata]|nr:hypothetical protein BKA57DRAFT_504252 [Linnemannia elongata]
MAPPHTVPVLKVDMLASSCDRCGRGFKAKRKNCHNCGVQVCKECSSFKTRLPQFGYTKPVRCCGYCSHFLYVYKMDDAALAKLNIKTLKRYLASYNISTHGMLEKQELIKAIQENRPLPEASEVYFRKNTPDTVEKSARIEEEIYSTSSHLPQGSGEERFWDLDKFFSKLFGNDDAPPRPPQRPEPTSTNTQKPQTVPRPQSYQQQPQPQPQPHSQPTKPGPFNFTQQPQPQPQTYQQQQYGYPPMPTPQPGATPHQATPTAGAHPYAPPTGATPTFFPAGSPPPNQGYYTAYPPGAAPGQAGYSTLNGHSQYQQHPFAQGAHANYQSTNAQYHQNNQTYYQQTHQQYPPQQGQQQHPFPHFQQGTSYYEKQSQSQPQAQPQPQPQAQQHPYQQQYNQNQHFHNHQQQQQHSHYTQQPQPAPYPASSTSSSSTSYTPNTTYGSNTSQGSQPKPQTIPSPKPTPQAVPQPQPTPQASPRPAPTPQAAPRPTPTPQAAPRPTSTPQATPQPTRPTSTSRPASTSTAPETPRPQATSRPASSSTSSQSRPVSSTPESPRRGPRAPQDRNDYSTLGSDSGSAPYSSAHSRQGSTAPEGPEAPPTPSSTSSRPPRQSNRGPQTEHSTSLLTIEEIVSENVDPSTLSIKVIKSLLDTNFVSYVGVVEKSDLVGQLQKLMISTRAEQVRIFNEQEAARKQSEQQEQQKQQQEQQNHQQQQQKASSTGSAANGGAQPPTTDDEHLCKICFEASLNCVMLNCGHMSTCMDCGKKIMEGPRVCPICREYVVNLLHVFKA